MPIANKLRRLDELSSLVPPDATVALGGAWFANHPMAAVRQLLRDGRRDLRLVALLGSIDVDLMVAAGAVRHLTFGMVSMDALGLPVHFRRAVQQGDLPITELSSITLQIAIDAAGRNIPCLPFSGPRGSDLVARHPEAVATIPSPFDGRETMVVKALPVDVAVVHATRCDDLGNAQFDGTYAQDPEVAKAASVVIVTCEEVVSREQIQATSAQTKIPGFLVDAVVEVPFGAHPCSHVPRYGLDAWELLAYQRLALAAGDDMAAYLDRLLHETEDQYRQRVLAGDRGPVLEALVDAAPVLVDR